MCYVILKELGKEVIIIESNLEHVHKLAVKYNLMCRSVMRVTVLQQTVGDVADLQQVLVEVFLHDGVNSPAHHLHAPLRPELNVVPDV